MRDAEIIASKATAEEMGEVPPALMEQMLENAEQLGPAGAFFRRVFGVFDFRGIEPVLPTRTFERELTLTVGGKSVRLLEVGPAHTRGDVLVHSPQDRIVFTGDILFIDGTPIVWEGPVVNWIRACQRIEAMDVDVVVPGHGPITDRGGACASTWPSCRAPRGLSARDAAHDIELGAYADWRDSERIAVNVETVYRELRGGGDPVSPLELFGRMAELARR